MYRKAFKKESTILVKKKNDPWDDEMSIEQCFASNDETTMEQHLDGLVANRIYRGERTIINNYYWYYYFPSHSEDEFADSQIGNQSANDRFNSKVQSEEKLDYMPPLADSDLGDLNDT